MSRIVTFFFVVRNGPNKYMMKKMYVATTRCAAAVVSAVVGWCSDERIRAPVLHDASQIDYCRYLGSASLPPITSIAYMVNQRKVAYNSRVYAQRTLKEYQWYSRQGA